MQACSLLVGLVYADKVKEAVLLCLTVVTQKQHVCGRLACGYATNTVCSVLDTDSGNLNLHGGSRYHVFAGLKVLSLLLTLIRA